MMRPDAASAGGGAAARPAPDLGFPGVPMTLPCFPPRWRSLLLLLLAPLAASAQTPRIAFAHFAPALDAVRIEIDGQAVETLRYAEYRPWRPIASGTRTLTARRADGSEIARSTLQVLGEDSITVFVAGGGGERAPFELLTALDHARPIFTGYSEQETMLALSGAEPASGVQAGSDCRLAPDNRDSYPRLGYRQGTLPLDSTALARPGYSISSSVRECGYRVWVEGSASAVALPPVLPANGSRLRYVIAGDGVRQPVRAHRIVQEVAPLAQLAPSPAFDGLWAVPARPGWLVVMGYEPIVGTERGQMRAFVLGHSTAGDDLWLRIDRRIALEVVGGSPDGSTPTFDDAVGLLEVHLHSADNATLVQTVPAATLHGTLDLFEPRPGQRGSDAVRLVKLLPQGAANPGGTP
jgi:hypothetical protein